MNRIARQLVLAATTTVLPPFTTAAVADDDHSAHHRDAYAVSGLVSDIAGTAANLDPVLQNAWGIAFSPAGSPAEPTC